MSMVSAAAVGQRAMIEDRAADDLAGRVDDLQNGAGGDTLAAAAFADDAERFAAPDRES